MNQESTSHDLPESLSSILDPKPVAPPAPVEPAVKEGSQAYDFRNPMLLSPRELRKLRMHQEEFVQALAARLSIHLRLEFILELSSLQTVAYQKMAASWANPAHLTLFKMEPIRGVSVLEISNHLGLCMVDRLMGGPGQASTAAQEISEIEKVLLEQTVQLVLEEWCHHWTGIKELKPSLLGYESNGRFVQIAAPETVMLVISLQAAFGDCNGRIQFGFSYATLEPLIRHFSHGAEALPTTVAPSAPAAPKWNSSFDGVCVPVTAEWDGLELTARQVVSLKVGDILPMDARQAQQINVRLADTVKFHGRPGKIAGQWAVELTQAVTR